MLEEKTSGINQRYRNFAMIVYPEHTGWYERLQNCHIAALVSPIHDKDTNDDGTLKKAHYHIMMSFEGKKSLQQIQELADYIGGSHSPVEIVHNQKAYARYLVHMDQKDKYQYDLSEVKEIAMNYYEIVGKSESKYAIISEMIEFVELYDVTSFYALAKYANKQKPAWHKVLCDSGSVYMRELLKSRRWSKDMDCMNIIDPNTGEIIS